MAAHRASIIHELLGVLVPLQALFWVKETTQGVGGWASPQSDPPVDRRAASVLGLTPRWTGGSSWGLCSSRTGDRVSCAAVQVTGAPSYELPLLSQGAPGHTAVSYCIPGPPTPTSLSEYSFSPWFPVTRFPLPVLVSHPAPCKCQKQVLPAVDFLSSAGNVP